MPFVRNRGAPEGTDAVGLLVEHPSQMLEITHRGKDFLKYLTHWGADISKKPC